MTRANRTMIPVEEAFAAWRKDSECVAAYDALEDEFSQARARAHDGLTQEELTDRMHATQAMIARGRRG